MSETMNYGQQQPVQPKQKKPFFKRTWVLVTGGIVAVIVVASAASGGGSDTPAKAESTPSAAVKAPAVAETPKAKTVPSKPVVKPKPKVAPAVACLGQEDRNAPCVVKDGQAFQLGSHQVLKGWKVKLGPLDWADVTGKAKNTGEKASSMIIDMKFFRNNELVMSASCTTAELEVGQSQAIHCLSTDNYTRKYDRITVEATF